jgi:hypothetical protein
MRRRFQDNHKAKQGMARQSQDKIRQDNQNTIPRLSTSKTRQSQCKNIHKTRTHKKGDTSQDKTKTTTKTRQQDKTRQDKTRQQKTRQGNTTQHNTTQIKTRHDEDEDTDADNHKEKEKDNHKDNHKDN